MLATITLERVYGAILQALISVNGAVSSPGSPSLFRLLCLRALGVKVLSPVWVGSGTEFIRPADLSLGERVAIGESCKIICHAPIEIGDDFVGATGLYINSGSHDIHSLIPLCEPIKIGKRVWCGMRVTICAGVEIGDDVVIGAGSVVTKSLPSGFLAYGIPAKPIRPLEREDLSHQWSVWNRKSLLSRVYGRLNRKAKNTSEKNNVR
jgi:acetyltransferase-like isoleucine patch superfamily enzyme